MSADSELLIKIKTILESQGIDAAKAKLAELTNTTMASGVAEAAVNQERSKTTVQAEKTARAVLAMNGALEGGMGPFRAAIHVANQMGGSLAMVAFKLSAVGAAMTIGFKIGTFLGELFTGAKEAQAELERVNKAADDLKEYVAKLNEIKLDKLKQEAKDVADGFSTAVDKAERLKHLSDMREDAQLATDIAKLNLRFEKKEITSNERDRRELQYQYESEQRKNQSEEKRINTELPLSQGRIDQATAKINDLSHQVQRARSNVEKTLDNLEAFSKSDIHDINGKGESDLSKVVGFNAKRFKQNGADDAYEKAVKKAKDLIESYRGGLVTDNSAQNISAIKRMETYLNMLKTLGDRQTVANGAQAAFIQEKPVYEKAVRDESINQENLIGARNVLPEKYDQTHAKYQLGNLVIKNKIGTEFDEFANKTRESQAVARNYGKEILDSVGVRPSPVMGNDGRPVSSDKQSELDSGRLGRAQDAVKNAVNSAYHGGDVAKIMDDLIQALNAQNARLVGMVSSKESLQNALNRIKNLETQQTVSRGVDQ